MEKQVQNPIKPGPTHPSSTGGTCQQGKNWPLILSITGLFLLVAGVAAFLILSKDKFAGQTPWILIAVAVLIILVGIAAVVMVKNKKERHEPDYYVFFIMGLAWMIVGIPMIWVYNYSMSGLFAMGVIFFIIGLANRDKWEKRTWHDLTPAERKMKTIIVVILGILVLLGLAAYFFTNGKSLF